ncbi:MAG TPA: hypothetical protein VFE53_23685 [Mucilaginibacter sp.]|jgi:hypothetical protein|nr:hypothetical protein [Mucilaginibacter sp.]
MSYDDLAPLYKILCLALIFLVPLAPAWGLYKIAPADKFLAKGNFSGFRINATGSAAIYIVLFSAIYVKTNAILDDIDKSVTLFSQVNALKQNIASLNEKRPWTIEYKLKLIKADGSQEIDPLDYKQYVNDSSVVCTPAALHVGDDSRTLTFYLNSDQFKSVDDTVDAQIMVHGHGTQRIPISRNSANVDTTNHKITLNPTIYLGTSDSAQLIALRNNTFHAKVLTLRDGTLKPPAMPR